MITKIKKVYYCEHCGKRSLAVWATARHEEHCTSNPDRTCRMCVDQFGPSGPWLRKPTRDYETLADQLEHGEEISGLAWIRPKDVYSLAEGCPACALTVLNLWRKKHGHKFVLVDCELNYKEEARKWLEARVEEDER